MNLLQTDRLQLLETLYTRPTAIRPMRCACVNAWQLSDPVPSLLVGSVLLVEVVARGTASWMLSHILIEDEYRRHGFATEIVRFYEQRLGPIGACWASDAGIRFAQAYTARFGQRPLWVLRPEGDIDQLAARLAGLLAERTKR